MFSNDRMNGFQQEKDTTGNYARNGSDQAMTFGRLFTEPTGPFTPFGSSSWDVALPSSQFEEPLLGITPSELGGHLNPLEISSSSGSMLVEGDLNVEKSSLLEQLRNMTAEVDRLEAKLESVKRRRERAVTAALEKHQENQETDAKEMRAILGSINQLSLKESMAKGIDPKSRGPLSNTPASIDIDMIQRLQNFTKISYTSIQNRIRSATKVGVTSREYQFVGHCYLQEFDVRFTVCESELMLEELQIKVAHSAQSELEAFLDRATRDRELMPFFQTFCQYAQMDSDRQKLMNTLAERFPRLVKNSRALVNTAQESQGDGLTSVPAIRSGAQVLTFSGPRQVLRLFDSEVIGNDPDLILSWIINATPQGRIIPQLQLLPRMPKKWRQADERSILDSIPTQFARLMQLRGVEGAVAILLRCIYGDDAEEAEEVEEDPK
ncbi:hypothetical protein BGW38_007197 [Lunasporangiospora selenospora]|uniref:Uncharacterized protein n=1 Tax=Lunasporangiospora selenospora TaxID=979761 RepID=A0A9P6FZC9_9FUNG|nr:hypothetical protein BGW38_007197 [Lunasporangiospora selenospora]